MLVLLLLLVLPVLALLPVLAVLAELPVLAVLAELPVLPVLAELPVLAVLGVVGEVVVIGKIDVLVTGLHCAGRPANPETRPTVNTTLIPITTAPIATENGTGLVLIKKFGSTGVSSAI